MTVGPAKAAEPIKMLFGMWPRLDPRNHVLDGDQIPTCEGAILRAKRDQPGHVRQSMFKATQQGRGQNWYGSDADWGVLRGMHIGATWQI